MTSMFSEGLPVDSITLAEAVQDAAYVAGLLDGCVPENAAAYVRSIKKAALGRRLAKEGEYLSQALLGQSHTKHDDVRNHAQRLLDSLDERESDDKAIRRFADIPDVLCMDLPPIEYIVPALGIARNTMTLYTGKDGGHNSEITFDVPFGFKLNFLEHTPGSPHFTGSVGTNLPDSPNPFHLLSLRVEKRIRRRIRIA